jgi:hypothetical protein
MLRLVKFPAQQALNFQLTNFMHCDWRIPAMIGITSGPLRKHGKGRISVEVFTVPIV